LVGVKFYPKRQTIPLASSFLEGRTRAVLRKGINRTMTLNSSGERLSLGEIENFRKSPGACPECKSAEGFWLIAKRESTFFQCKHCAAILEACKVFAGPKEPKHFKLVIKLQR
jgi:hypothetical protein